MSELELNINFIIGSAGAVLGAFLGTIDGLLIGLLMFVAIDYITGMSCAITKKCICSDVGFKGILKKVTIFMLVGIANIIDVYVLEKGSVIRSGVIFFYLSNEGISILENADALGLPIPQKLRAILKKINSENTESMQNTDNTEN